MATRGKTASTSVGFVIPLLILMALAFNIPLVAMLARSFGTVDFTLEHYESLIRVPVYMKVVGNTFYVAAIASLCCALLGYPLAYWMRGLSPTRQLIVIGFVVVPFWISVLVRTYAWIVILGNGGLVNQGLLALGWIGAPVSFLYNTTGVTIGTINVLLPFLVLPLFAAMIKIDERLLQAAASLGAPPRVIFWKIFFPLTLPALAAGTIMVFILTLGFYVTPAVLGGGRVSMIANMLDLLINRMPRWELAAAISTTLLALTLLLYAASRWVGERKAI
jgi:ABC-type spermidine/putrescine transport system permease subunit I